MGLATFVRIPLFDLPRVRILFFFMCRLLFLGDGAHLPSGLVRCLCLALLTLAAPSVEPNLEDGTSERLSLIHI